jgi:hypothetical protein
MREALEWTNLQDTRLQERALRGVLLQGTRHGLTEDAMGQTCAGS